ncbi:MAG: hypothetical protein J6A85_00945, partial [Clostridia bacterium]|nr:hypothetical protein [Clostridia bacterium]
ASLAVGNYSYRSRKFILRHLYIAAFHQTFSYYSHCFRKTFGVYVGKGLGRGPQKMRAFFGVLLVSFRY